MPTKGEIAGYIAVLGWVVTSLAGIGITIPTFQRAEANKEAGFSMWAELQEEKADKKMWRDKYLGCRNGGSGGIVTVPSPVAWDPRDFVE